MNNRRKAPPLGRKAGERPPAPRLFIFSEGERTEPEYLRLFEEEHCGGRGKFLEIICPGADPRTLVIQACEKARDLKKRMKKERLAQKDQVWCIFDIDDHPRISEVKEMARANGVEVAISNPCFELWALLHFQDHDAPVHRHDLCRKLQQRMPGYDPDGCKQLDYALLTGNPHVEACRRAKRINENRRLENRPGGNPSTEVYRLLDRLKELAGAQRRPGSASGG